MQSLWIIKSVKAIAEKEIFLLRLQEKLRIKNLSKNGPGCGFYRSNLQEMQPREERWTLRVNAVGTVKLFA